MHSLFKPNAATETLQLAVGRNASRGLSAGAASLSVYRGQRPEGFLEPFSAPHHTFKDLGICVSGALHEGSPSLPVGDETSLSCAPDANGSQRSSERSASRRGFLDLSKGW